MENGTDMSNGINWNKTNLRFANSSNSGFSAAWILTYSTHTTYILTVIGLLGNVLTVIILLLSPKRSKASRLYLMVLAVTDS